MGNSTYFIFTYHVFKKYCPILCAGCPRSLVNFNTATCYFNMDRISWTCKYQYTDMKVGHDLLHILYCASRNPVSVYIVTCYKVADDKSSQTYSSVAVHVYLFGMKYPASRMMGGSMNRKNRFGVNVEGGCSDVRKRRKPEGI